MDAVRADAKVLRELPCYPEMDLDAAKSVDCGSPWHSRTFRQDSDLPAVGKTEILNSLGSLTRTECLVTRRLARGAHSWSMRRMSAISTWPLGGNGNPGHAARGRATDSASAALGIGAWA